MSTTSKLIAVYSVIGLLLMTAQFAKEKKGHRSESLLPVADNDGFTAGLLIFVVLLWPVWLIVELTKDDEKE